MKNIKHKLFMMFWILVCTGASFATVYAQNDLKTIMAQIGKMNDANKIVYSYKMELFTADKNKCIDSLKGKLYRYGADYIDSSFTSMTLVSGNYCLKINQNKKTATIYDLNYLHKKLGVEFSHISQAFVIPDSDIIKHGKLSESSGIYTIEVVPSTRPFSRVITCVRKADFHVMSMVFESKERHAGKTSYIRRYTINNIQALTNASIFDINRYMSIHNKSVILNKRYSDFKVKTITG